jgi:hypothetical protein
MSIFVFIENRPTADELERLELPWAWKSYSVSLKKNFFFPRNNLLFYLNSLNVIGVVMD